MIRKATAHDYKSIAMALNNKKIPYITAAHAHEDIKNNRQYVLEENGKIIGIISIVYDSQYKYYAMKRLCILNKKNNGKGYAFQLLSYCAALPYTKIGCTPWTDNEPMKHMLTKLNFQLEYIFNDKWCFYSKE